MVVNPVGPVYVYDAAAPRFITALTPVGVTGGQLVYLSGAANVVGSSWDGFSTGSVLVGGVASGLFFNGVVLTQGNTASGTAAYVSIATDGFFLLTAGSDVFGGQAVECLGADSVQRLGSFAVPAGPTDAHAGGRKMGRAITGASSGTAAYCLIQITP